MSTFSKLLFGTSLVAASLGAAPASADPLDGLGRWSGSGTSLSPEGKPLGEFHVELTRSAAGPDRVETRGTVTLAQGKSFRFGRR